MFRKEKPMMPRPENDRKFQKDNKADRALLKMLVLLMGAALLLIVAVVIVSIFVFGM
jgi:hypothetical protein